MEIPTNLPRDLKTATMSGLGWSGATQITQQLLAFVILALLARFLTPEDFGLVGMIVVLTGFGAVFSEAGLGAALVHRKDLRSDHIDTVFWLSIGIGVAMSVLTAVAGPWIAAFYDRPELARMTAVMGIGFIFTGASAVPMAMFQKEMDFRTSGLVTLVATAAGGGIALVAAVMGVKAWSLIIQSLVFSGLCMVLLQWKGRRWLPRSGFSLASLAELWRFAGNFLGFNVVNYWVRNADNLLVGRYVGATQLGLYGRAYGTMLLPIAQLGQIAGRVMFPALASIQGDLPRFQRLYLSSTRVLGLLTFPLLAGLLAVSDDFVVAVYGAQWEAAGPLLAILCFATLTQPISATMGWIYTSQGRTDVMFRWGMVAGAVRILGFAVGLQWGAVGVAWSYAFTSHVVLWYPSWTIPGRIIGLPFSRLIANVLPALLCACVMSAGTWMLGKVLPDQWHSGLRLAVLVPCGIAMYTFLVSLFRLQAFRDVIALGKELVKRPRKGRAVP